jgi:hypothetical protein
MGYLSALQNLSREIRASATSVASASNTVYITIPNWQNFSIIKSLVITANNSVANPTISIVNHSGEVANSTNLAITWGSEIVSNLNAPISFSDLYVEDLYRTNCLYIKISAAAITVGTIFNITAIGESRNSNTQDSIDSTTWLRDISFKNFVTHTDGSYTDYTQLLKKADNPYGVPVLQDSTDFWYIGSFNKITNIYFNKPDISNTSGISEIKYWNGAWTTLPSNHIFDGTSNNDSGGLVNLSYNGVMRINPPSDWVATNISQDPMASIDAAIEANYGRHSDAPLPPQVLVYGPYYWIRMAATSNLPLKLISMKQVRPAGQQRLYYP